MLISEWNLCATIGQDNAHNSAYVFTFEYTFGSLKDDSSQNLISE